MTKIHSRFSQWIIVLAILALSLNGCGQFPASGPNITDTPWIIEITATPAPSVTPPEPTEETFPTPLPTSAVSPTPVPLNKRGVHLLLDDGRNTWPNYIRDEHIRAARQVVGEWGFVTQVIKSNDLDTEKWQHFMDMCAEVHLIPIIRFATTFNHEINAWDAPTGSNDVHYYVMGKRFGKFVAALRWPTNQHYVIIGNEPNHGNEWGGAPDPNQYGHYLVDVADAIHERDPNAKVMNAGFDLFAPNSQGQPLADGFVYMDAETFINEMVRQNPDVLSHIDIWSSHAYPTGPFANSPGDQVRQPIDPAPGPNDPPAGTVKLGINSYEWELWKLSTYGVTNLPIMITETGWRHSDSVDPNSPDTGQNLPDAATVAQYFDQAYYGPSDGSWTPWMDDPRIIAVTPFALDGSPDEWGHTNWLQIDHDGTILGTYPMFDLLSSKAP